MPPTILEKELARFQSQQEASGIKGVPSYCFLTSEVPCPTGKPVNIHATFPRAKASSQGVYRPLASHDYDVPPHRHPPPSRPETQLNRVRPPPTLSRNSYSQPQALNQLRHELRNTIPASKTPAWHSQPSSRQPSRAGSRQVSRTGSRNPSTSSIGVHNPLQEITDLEDLEFHPVDSYMSKYKGSQAAMRHNASILESSDNDVHFPIISHATARPPTNSHKHSRQNGLLSPGADVEIRTEMPLDAIVSEVVRVATNLDVLIEQTTMNTISCTWRALHFQVIVNKALRSPTCHLAFKWLSGGDHKTYLDTCKQLIQRIRL